MPELIKPTPTNLRRLRTQLLDYERPERDMIENLVTADAETIPARLDQLDRRSLREVRHAAGAIRSDTLRRLVDEAAQRRLRGDASRGGAR